VRFSDLFSRADESVLETILTGSTIRILSALDQTLAYNKYLRNLVLEIYGPHFLLQTSKIRQELFNLLKPNEARLLLQYLGKRETASWQNDQFVYNLLAQISVTKGSEIEKKIFAFFDLDPLPEPITTPEYENNVVVEYSLFKHQRHAVEKVKKLLNTQPCRVLLHMPTGAGKTRTAMNVIADHMRANEPTVVVWLANTEELCDQALQEMRTAWRVLGNREIGVFKFWGSHALDLDDPKTKDCVVIASLTKVYNVISRGDIKYISRLGSRSSLTVMDEAHQAVAPTYQLVLNALSMIGQENKMLGLSATPGRTWNDIDEDKKLSELFARKKVKLEIDGFDNPVDYLTAEGYLAAVEFQSIKYTGNLKKPLIFGDSIDIPDSVLKLLGEDQARNLMIIRETEKLSKNGHNRILVFAPSVECANQLAVILKARGYNAASVTGETPGNMRARLISEYKNVNGEARILCNFGVLTTGFDAPQTSAAVIGRPTYSLVLFSQMVGRAIRGPKAGGNSKATIVTVVDTNLPGFDSVANAFNNWEDVWE